MDQLTPQEAEILRLWGVIRKLENRVHMTDREEALFGEVYQEFKRPGTTPPATGVPRVVLLQIAAQSLRALLACQEKP